MALTNTSKVRNRLNIEQFQASDAVIAEFITDADGLISHYIGGIPSASDDNYALAVSTSTGLAAYYTGTQMPYPEDKDESKAWADKLNNLRKIADVNLEILGGVQTPVPVAKSTTVD